MTETSDTVSPKPQVYLVNQAIENAIGACHAEYSIDIQSYLASDVMVSFVPAVQSENKRAGAIKVPAHFIKQLASIPQEIQGVPIEFLIKLAHKIKDDEGKSILDITNEKKIDIPQKRLIL